jgi:hypothetical protein
MRIAAAVQDDEFRLAETFANFIDHRPARLDLIGANNGVACFDERLADSLIRRVLLGTTSEPHCHKSVSHSATLDQSPCVDENVRSAQRLEPKLHGQGPRAEADAARRLPRSTREDANRDLQPT